MLNATAVLQPVLSPKQQWLRGGVLRANEAPRCAWVYTSSIVCSQSNSYPPDRAYSSASASFITPTVQLLLPLTARVYLLCPIHQPQVAKTPTLNNTLYTNPVAHV